MPSIFLSHNEKDKPFARRLAANLRARGLKVWLDEAEMYPGDSLLEKIEVAISSVDYLGVVLSPNSVDAPWVLKEVRVALHREISGKKVVVVPCLLADCEIPVFLADKIYADFRNPENYDQAIDAIVKRTRRDLHENKELSEALNYLEDVPFTKLWRTALETRSFSDRFAGTIKRILTQLQPGVNWSPAIAASYLFFLKEIREQGIQDQRLWSALLQIIEDTNVTDWLRYETLSRTFILFKLMIRADPEKVIRLFTDAQHQSLRVCLFERYLGPDQNQQTDAAIDLLTESWPILDRSARRELAEGLLRFVADQGSDPAAMRAVLVQEIDAQRSYDVFNQLRGLWQQTKSLDDEDRYRQAVDQVLEALTNHERCDAARGELVVLYRTASRLQEQNDYGLYSYLAQAVSSEHLRLVAELQGKHFVFGLLGDIIKDPEIEVVFSVLALGTLLHEGYGRESLLLDDDLIPSLLKQKRRGQPPCSVVEALCEEFEAAEDGWSALVLRIVQSVMSDAERAELKVIIRNKRPGARRMSFSATT